VIGGEDKEEKGVGTERGCHAADQKKKTGGGRHSGGGSQEERYKPSKRIEKNERGPKGGLPAKS